MKPHILRLILTTLILLQLKILEQPLIYPIASLFILDSTDCGLYKLYDKDYDCSKTNISYQIKDKIIDLYAYWVFLALFFDKLDPITLNLYIIFFIYRFYGVYLFYKTKNIEYIKIFFDGMNGLLILFELTKTFDVIKNNYSICLGLMMGMKILFEKIHHNMN